MTTVKSKSKLTRKAKGLGKGANASVVDSAAASTSVQQIQPSVTTQLTETEEIHIPSQRAQRGKARSDVAQPTRRQPPREASRRSRG
jgi:hypothetical protein